MGLYKCGVSDSEGIPMQHLLEMLIEVQDAGKADKDITGKVFELLNNKERSEVKEDDVPGIYWTSVAKGG